MQPKEDDLEWFESDNQRELRQIFQGQSIMSESLKDLSRKLDEVIGRQERTLSLISLNSQGVGQVAPVPQGGHQQQPPPPSHGGGGGGGDGIRRYDVDTLLNNQNLLVSTVREIRSIIGEIHARTDTIITNQARQPTAQIQSTGYDVQALISEMRDGLNQVKQGVAAVGQK